MTSSTTATSLEPSVDKPLSETPNSRRQHVAGTLDDSGHISIEQYIYRRDHYLSTSLALPLPLPMMAVDGFKELKNYYEADEGFRMAIFQVLERLGYPTGDVPIPVLQILVDTDEAGDFVARWCTARREITPLLDDHDLQEQEVDIHDPKRYYQPWLFPIHPNHPAVALFNLVKDELMKMVCTHIESAWNMFSMFQSRLADNVKRPAVVLVVASLTEYDWASLRASLEEIIAEKETGDRSGLRVEIMPGCISSGDVSDWK